MIEVVAGHGFDNGSEGHLTPLRVGELLGKQLGRDAFNESQIPLANRGKYVERGLGVVRAVVLCPTLLVEGLDDVIILGEHLAKAEGEDDFAIGEVAEDFAGVPFIGRRFPLEAAGAQGGDMFPQLFGRGAYHGERIPVSEKLRVGVHATNLAQAARPNPDRTSRAWDGRLRRPGGNRLIPAGALASRVLFPAS